MEYLADTFSLLLQYFIIMLSMHAYIIITMHYYFVGHTFLNYYFNTLLLCWAGTFTFVTEDNNQLKFTTPYHFENIVRSAGSVTLPSRARRLAQEVVTLSTSLPLSASSSVFVRCDEEHLDVMKVASL